MRVEVSLRVLGDGRDVLLEESRRRSVVMPSEDSATEGFAQVASELRELEDEVRVAFDGQLARWMDLAHRVDAEDG